jgi:hypothetical protein
MKPNLEQTKQYQTIINEEETINQRGKTIKCKDPW